jgi:hypothetical protein
MKKHEVYTNVRFKAEVLKEVVDVIQSIAKRHEKEPLSISQLIVSHDDSTWHHDKMEEFLADFRKYKGNAYAVLTGGGLRLAVDIDRQDCAVKVTAADRADIETVFDVFEKSIDGCRLPPVPNSTAKPIIFIGHGRSVAWRDLKDHLQDKHGIQIEAYETGARAGHAIRDILEDMVSKVHSQFLF